MSLHYRDILSFISEMGMSQVGFGISKKTPEHALKKAIRLLNSDGLPLHKARNVICLFRILPSTYLEEIQDAADLLFKKIHRDADALWTTALPETPDEINELQVLIVAGNFS